MVGEEAVVVEDLDPEGKEEIRDIYMESKVKREQTP